MDIFIAASIKKTIPNLSGTPIQYQLQSVFHFNDQKRY